MTPNQAADLYLSMACGGLSLLRSLEPAPHTRRARKLADLESRLIDLLVTEYQSGLCGREGLEIAANVIRTTEAQLMADLENNLNDGSD